MQFSRLVKGLNAVRQRPVYALAVAGAIGKGAWLKFWLPRTGRRFSAGRNFRVFGSLTVRGPGRVTFGDDVLVDMHVTPFTHEVEAEIVVGNNVFLNGTRFGCAKRIEVGAYCILADAQIMDTNFHSTDVNRHSREAPIRVDPVIIEENVWIAGRVGILPGTRVGRNSVVGFGSVCSGSFEQDRLIAGNPARVIRSLEGSRPESAASRFSRN